MQALVIFESVSDASRDVARAVGDGLFHLVGIDVEVVPAAAAAALLGDLDLLVVGGPARAEDERGGPSDAVGTWLRHLGTVAGTAAATFDTRVLGDDGPSAAAVIGERLTGRGYRPIAAAESFRVDATGVLLPGEADRAKVWGEGLGRTVVAAHLPRPRMPI
ncbi:hypothetical protein [uncultured Cellulomonas sp.]|uniref:hypothetical protein n=1 Tax=uncultured Cellulomonas sp. TaxID=189682 RepID=UPI00261D8228|nr:hypothetical protein [uncultured Cellulomonas sp.]